MIRKAGALLMPLAAGGALGAGGLALAQYLMEQATPKHSREMTQDEHAKNNMLGTRQRTGVSAKDLALYEGIRQGLMAGEITGDEVNAMAAKGQLPKRVIDMLADVHDWGAYEPNPWPESAGIVA